MSRYNINVNTDIELLMSMKTDMCFDTVFSSNYRDEFTDKSVVGTKISDDSLSVNELEDLFQAYIDENDKILSSLQEYDIDSLLDVDSDYKSDIIFDESASQSRKDSQEFSFDSLEAILKAKQLEKTKKEAEELNRKLQDEYLSKQEELNNAEREKSEKLKQAKLDADDEIANVRFEAEEAASKLREEAEEQARLLSKQIKESAIKNAANIIQNAKEEAERLAIEAKEEAEKLSRLKIEEENNKVEELRIKNDLEKRRINIDREIAIEKLKLEEKVINQKKENELMLAKTQQQNKLLAMQRAHETELAMINARILTGSEIMPEEYPLHIPNLDDVRLPTSNSVREIRVGKRRELSQKTYTVYAVASAVSGSFGSTIAYNLARSLVNIHKCKVLLIDMDVKRADLSFKFKLNKSINKVFSLPFCDYLNTFDDNIANISIGDVCVGALGCKPYSSLNTNYKKFIVNYDYQKLLHVYGREFNFIVLDLGTLENMQKYQYTLLQSDLTRGLICINANNKSSLAASLGIASYFDARQSTIITNYSKNFNIEKLSIKLCKPLAGTIPNIEAPFTPIYDNIQVSNVCGNFNRIIHNIR